jgi:hypothetical protein
MKPVSHIPRNKTLGTTALRFGATLLMIALLVSCAGQQSPSGGPVDKTPPEVIAASPAPGTLRVRDARVTIAFDKYVNKLRVQQAIFVSPNAGQLNFDWGGKDVEIRFADTLRPNTTYILTVGTDAEDTHGNKLAETYALPFSTGDRIDSASISGHIVDPQPLGVMVFAYRLDGRLADTLNPSKMKPDFLTQSGKKGLFSLTNLAPGRYRVVAVRDEYKDLLYNSSADAYGLWTGDIALPAETSAVRGVQFQLTSTDTAAPFLSSARPVNAMTLLLRFNKAMDFRTLDPSRIVLRDTLGLTTLSVDEMTRGDAPTEAYALTARMDSGRVYRVELGDLRDIHGNRISAASSNILFEGSGRPDTGQMMVRFMSGGDSLRNIDPADTLKLDFSRPVRRQAVAKAISMEDSTAHRMGLSIGWEDAFTALLQPSGLSNSARYRVRIVLDSVEIAGRRPFHDSTLIRTFFTLGEDQYGTLKGTIFDESRSREGRYVLLLTELSRKGTAPKILQLDSAGGFRWNHLREGKYQLWGFVDRDGDGRYSYGTPAPFQPSERFAVYPDTLKIRIRWPLEGIELRFR